MSTEEKREGIKSKAKPKYVFVDGKNNRKHPGLGIISEEELTNNKIRQIKQYDKIHKTHFFKLIKVNE